MLRNVEGHLAHSHHGQPGLAFSQLPEEIRPFSQHGLHNPGRLPESVGRNLSGCHDGKALQQDNLLVEPGELELPAQPGADLFNVLPR